jgi:hypothetical protein
VGQLHGGGAGPTLLRQHLQATHDSKFAAPAAVTSPWTTNFQPLLGDKVTLMW